MAMLVGDNERDRTAHELRRHYREGRLSVDELAQRLETALRARDGAQLRSALSQLPAAGRWADPEAVRAALRSPLRGLRNAAILAGTAVVWLFWSVGMLVAFVAWLAANGPSLGALVVFPVLWLAASWLLWTSSKRRRSRR
jgi:Flp pilus assembly protein TadB